MRNAVWIVLLGALSVATAGCSEPVATPGIAQTNDPAAAPVVPVTSPSDRRPGDPGASEAENTTDPGSADASAAGQPDPARPRTFAVEGPNGALRVTFDDLDLLKVINMDEVTADCVSKMPQWMRDLAGKKVRIRGFMKPLHVSEGLPEFPLVRSTDLCCFGPKGKVYHRAAVTLKAGTTTDYIELRPFDVVGTFRIEPIQLGDEPVFLLYHIDDATIIQK